MHALLLQPCFPHSHSVGLIIHEAASSGFVRIHLTREYDGHHLDVSAEFYVKVASLQCDGTRRTYIDESFRQAQGVVGPGSYLFAAVSVDVVDEERICKRLRASLPASLSRFHRHHDTDDTRRLSMTKP